MKTFRILIALIFLYSIAKSQDSNIHSGVEVQAIGTTGGTVPFWLRANQYGSIPLSGASGSVLGNFRKDYDSTKKIDWGVSFEGRGNLGGGSHFILVEGLVKARAGIFELKAGRSKDIVGLTDSTLSSGSFAVSGNALGIPKIGISIPNYYSIPLFDKLFAIKAEFANGYLGNIGVQYDEKPTGFKGYYLENYGYLRIGKPGWRLKFEAGFNHEAMWGNEGAVFGPDYKLSSLQTYWYVVSGKVYNYSKVGNHIGSLDLGAEYRFDNFMIKLYRQNIYDKGALSHLANLADGLNGLSMVNAQTNSGNFYWKKFVFEFLYTVNQAGYPDSKETSSGAEDYYNNYEYTQGWSYNYLGLGTPFITPAYLARSNLPSAPLEFFINNRVSLFHAAAQIYLFQWFYTGKLSYSQNYGTYANGNELYRGVNGELIAPDANEAFKRVQELSAYLEGMRPLKNGYSVGYDIGIDHGHLLNNSVGVILKASKSFL